MSAEFFRQPVLKGFGLSSRRLDRRLIVVGDQLRTSNPDIFAVGECAQHRGRVYGLVAPLWDQANVLAEYITGANPEAVYQGSKLPTKLKVMGVGNWPLGVIAGDWENEDVVQSMSQSAESIAVEQKSRTIPQFVSAASASQ